MGAKLLEVLYGEYLLETNTKEKGLLYCNSDQERTLFFHFQADKVDAQLHTLLIKVEPQVGTILKVSDY